MHEEEPLSLTSPAAHIVHEEEPMPLYVPASQSVQVTEFTSVEKLPEGQTKQAPSLTYFPETHRKIGVVLLQSSKEEERGLLVLPSAQAMHATVASSPAALIKNVPATQPAQSLTGPPDQVPSPQGEHATVESSPAALIKNVPGLQPVQDVTAPAEKKPRSQSLQEEPSLLE